MPDPTRLPFAKGEAVVEVVAGAVRVTTPPSGLDLTDDEAQHLARKLVLASTHLDAELPADVRESWRRRPMQYLRFDTEPAEEGAAEPAIIHAWIAGQTEANAYFVAAGNIEAGGEYVVTELLEQTVVTAADYSEDHEHRQYFEQALVDSEVFLFELFEEDDS